mmetsp:Transcript_68422/g.200167  ORF Transcript_68422/g.200167 Transcript_68422/m.200167 type:complete len:214 (-) Transcript_68422:221-862(-)
MQPGAEDGVVDGRWSVAAALAHHIRVPLVLLGWVREAIADGHALEVDALIPRFQVGVALEDAVGHGRDVVAGVALAGDVEVLVVLRHGLEEDLQELVHVLGHAILVVVPLPLGEACARGLVDPHHISPLGPRVRVCRRCAVRIDLAWAVLKEEPRHGGAAGATCEPHHHGVLCRVAAALKHPEEVLLLLLPESEVAAVLLDDRVTKSGRALDA